MLNLAVLNRSKCACLTVLLLLTAVPLPGTLSPSAMADEITMKNGNTFKGQILEEDDKQIVLKMQYGTMSFKKEKREPLITSIGGQSETAVWVDRSPFVNGDRYFSVIIKIPRPTKELASYFVHDFRESKPG